MNINKQETRTSSIRTSTKNSPTKVVPKKILVCGDRNWWSWPTMEKVLCSYLTKDDTLITGGAKGADAMAERIGREVIKCKVEVYIADWAKYGRAAGPIRNRRMLGTEPDLVLAFHENISKSKGTADCINEAGHRGIQVVLISEIEKENK